MRLASSLLLVLLTVVVLVTQVSAFVVTGNARRAFLVSSSRATATCLHLAAADNDHNGNPRLKRVSPDLEGIPIPFVDFGGNSFIECYAESVAHINGVEYTIGVPCDNAVALGYLDEEGQLVLIEVDEDDLMDDVFPVAEAIVEEEFGEELVLQRTPQTLTLVGELETTDDEEESEEDDDLSLGDEEDEEQEVEVLISFEHRGKEYNLVRLLDPVLLVGKRKPGDPETASRVLLSLEESEEVMPILEELVLEFTDDPEAILP